jgi:hypothetical protein
MTDDKTIESLTCNPSIVFDEIHTFWFVECLKTLCNSFATKNESKKTVIIFDNSPGFIGINPAIQDWLSDIGPARAKFLTISSLDQQDLVSCSRSVEELHSKFNIKHVATKKYFEMDNDNKIEFDLESKYNNFFLRIVSDSIDDETKEYYNKSLINSEDKFIIFPSKYQSIIFNKVPKEIKNKIVTYNFNKIWKIIDKLFTVKQLIENNNIYNHFVYYDEYINFQFIESSLIKTNPKDYNLNLKSRYFYNEAFQ